METTAGFQLWAPSVLPELTSQTCRSSLGVLQRRGLILSTGGGSLRPCKGQEHGEGRRAPHGSTAYLRLH